MMRRPSLLALAVAGLALVVPVPPAAAAQTTEPFRWEEVGVADLLADPEAHTTLGVVVRGELVGDFGVRADGTVWTQLNDDPYATAPLLAGGSLAGANQGIGVRIPAELWPGLERPGGYRVRGPLVELRGRWRYHDPGRGGESYLEVTSLVLLEPPRELEEGVGWLPLGLGAGLLGLALTVGLRTRRRGD